MKDVLALDYRVVFCLDDLQLGIALVCSLSRRDGLLGLIVVICQTNKTNLFLFIRNLSTTQKMPG